MIVLLQYYYKYTQKGKCVKDVLFIMEKVLFVSHTTDFLKFNIPYIQWFKMQGWEIHYASMEEIGFPEGIVDYHYKIPFSRSPFTKSNLNAYTKLKKIIDTGEYKLIHCHTPVGGVVARLASKDARKNEHTKVIYTAHGLHFYKGAPIRNWIVYYPVEKVMSLFSDAVVTINNEDYNLAKRKFFCPVYHIKGVGVDLERFHRIDNEEKIKLRLHYGYNENDFIMVYAAELNSNKNQFFLIKTMPHILKVIPEAKLLLAGYGELREKLKELIVQLHLEDVVYLLGYRNDIDKLYQLSDVGVSASIREGLGLNVLEEMACGLPVVVSSNRGHREIVQNGENGYVFRNGNEDDFIMNIRKIYRNVKESDKISRNNLRKVKEYSVEKTIEQMAFVYEKVLADRR